MINSKDGGKYFDRLQHHSMAKALISQAPMTHACNSSYLASKEAEIRMITV
jgi:hypothetical protein